MVAFTTESPDDYNFLSIPLQFGKCEVKQCFNVTINDNLKVEPDEEFTLVLESPSHAAIVELNPQIATVTIVDDDSESLSFFDTLLNLCFFLQSRLSLDTGLIITTQLRHWDLSSLLLKC